MVLSNCQETEITDTVDYTSCTKTKNASRITNSDTTQSAYMLAKTSQDIYNYYVASWNKVESQQNDTTTRE